MLDSDNAELSRFMLERRRRLQETLSQDTSHLAPINALEELRKSLLCLLKNKPETGRLQFVSALIDDFLTHHVMHFRWLSSDFSAGVGGRIELTDFRRVWFEGTRQFIHDNTKRQQLMLDKAIHLIAGAIELRQKSPSSESMDLLPAIMIELGKVRDDVAIHQERYSGQTDAGRPGCHSDEVEWIFCYEWVRAFKKRPSGNDLSLTGSIAPKCLAEIYDWFNAYYPGFYQGKELKVGRAMQRMKSMDFEIKEDMSSVTNPDYFFRYLRRVHDED